MSQIFNNREIASAIWLLLFGMWAITSSRVRASFQDVIRAFLKWQIIIPLVAMSVYVVVVVGCLYTIGFWDVSAMKDTVFWILGFASMMLFRANEVDKRYGFFRNAILDNLKLIVVLEFILNMYTFSLWIELLLVPFATLIIMLKAVSEFQVKLEPRYKAVDSFLSSILALIGIVMLSITIHSAINDLDRFMKIHNLRDFMLPAVLSGLYLPFIYAWALYLAYELLFVRIDIFNSDRNLARHLKKVVLLTFHVKLWHLLQWARQAPGLHVNSQEDAAILVKGVKK
jgi:hypothetical protein